MIQKINPKLGLNYPLQDLRKFPVSDTDKRILNFAIEERNNADAKKESLSEKLEETKLNIAIALGITIPTITYSLICTKAIENPNGTVDVVKIVADNTYLQVKLNLALKTQAQAETFMNLRRDCHPKSNYFQKEIAALKQESEKIESYLSYYKVVTQFCSRVRHGFHHSGRRVHHGSTIRNMKDQSLVNKDVIDVYNKTCREVDTTADFALFMVDPNRIGWGIGGERHPDLTKSYHITPEYCKKLFLHSKGSPPGVLLDLLNMHATMYKCYFKTTYSCNVKNDKDFEVSFEKLFAQYKCL